MKANTVNIAIITFLMINLSVLHAQVNLSKGRFLRGKIYPGFTINTSEADFYVSPDGNDNWSGTLAEPNAGKTDGPFATLERAQAAVRELKGKIYKPKVAMDDPRYKGSEHKYGAGKDILVLIREGTYNLNKPLVFTAEDGGERIETDLPTGAFEYHKLKDHYVTYVAYPGEKVIISGGKEVKGWRKKHGRLWIVKTARNSVDEVFVNGSSMTLAKTQKFPVVKGTVRAITFSYKFIDPGEHTVAIGAIKPKEINIAGKPLYSLYCSLEFANRELPDGDIIVVSSLVENVRNEDRTEKVVLRVDGREYTSKDVLLKKGESLLMEFPVSLSGGNYVISVGNLPAKQVRFYDFREINVADEKFLGCCSGTARPYCFMVANGKFEIESCGTDFLHAEDSYGAIYPKDAVQGDFVAMVKVTGFSKGVSDWIRAGIFVRNDIAQSNESEKGNKGAFLAFITPKWPGAQWDEFGDGSMHNTKSYNYDRNNPFPVWLKVVREKDVFTADYSFDGKNWIFVRRTTPLPGLDRAMDIGLASGTNDQKPSKTFFEDFKIKIEKR